MAEEYKNGKLLGQGEDMAHHKYDAYKYDGKIYIVYESGHVASEEITVVRADMDAYLWTPYIEWVL